jgi:drug/metabolite transporter (DMT)-like permease
VNSGTKPHLLPASSGGHCNTWASFSDGVMSLRVSYPAGFMSQLFAALASALYGIADFAGGVASRQMKARQVAPWSQLFGIPLLLIGLFVVGWDHVAAVDLAYGAVAGVFGFIGVVALYGALAAGTMSIVSPLTGALTALIPVLWALAAGEHITSRQWIGIVIAIVAITLVAWDHAHAKLTSAVVARAIVAAFGFSGFFITLSYTAGSSGQWPLIAGRAVSITLGFGILLVLRELSPPNQDAVPAIAVAGTGDAAANIAVLLALQTGPLGISVVLISIYPAFTALAAVIFLHERPTVVQRVGIVLALVAGVLLVV